ncbi:MAG: hypothetical protein SGPRY_005602 [Prymnesium sp.]
MPTAPPSSSALALFRREQQRAQARGETRCELMALNAVLRTCGAPALSFAPPAFEAGTVFSSRAEMCVVGLHRHLLSEASFTSEGVESLVLCAAEEGADAHADHGERVYFTPSPRRAGALFALSVNVSKKRPVRLIRAEFSERSLPSSATRQKQGRPLCYRYDGLYLVVQHAPFQHPAPEGGFLLVRQAGQPALVKGGGAEARKRRREEASGWRGEASPCRQLGLVGALIAASPTSTLPLAAEQVRTTAPSPRSFLPPSAE